MTTNGTWIQTPSGQHLFDQGDGWYFDYASQSWFFGDTPPSIPTGAPFAARRRRFWHRLTERPRGIWLGWLTPVRGEGFSGFLCFLIAWACRGYVAYALGWITLHAGGVWRGLVIQSHGDAYRNTGLYKTLADEPGGQEALALMVKALVLVAFAVLAFLFLVILSLNAEQSAALTTAFVAHRMYRHFVEDVGGSTQHRLPSQRGP